MDAKYYYIILELNLPADNKFALLKTHPLKTFELSDAKRAPFLFSLYGLWDGKPSELMDRMLNLLGDNCIGFLFTQLFMRQLPPHE